MLFAVSSLSAQETRHFTFHYAFTVKNVPAGEKLRVWIPAAHSDNFQEVKVISATGDLPLKKTHESTLRQRDVLRRRLKSQAAGVSFRSCLRCRPPRAPHTGRHTPSSRGRVNLPEKERKLDLAPDALVPTTGLPAELAVKVTEGKTDTLDKARAIYDYVFTTMRYDKTGTGWGRGDVLYACDAKKGNCTDFHSLFIAMARSQGIPARFEIGFPLPPDKHAAEIAGYHCWADFFDPAARMDSRRHLRSLEAPGETRLLLRRSRRQPRAVHHGPRS